MAEKILIQRKKSRYMEHIGREVTLIKQKRYFVKDTSRPFHTQYGEVSAADLKKPAGSVIRSGQGKELVVLDADFIDRYRRISRGAQIIPLKDIGAIITATGIGKGSRIVDAGAGSGALAIMLAHVAKKVVTYELRDDHYRIAKENITALGIKNITLKKGDVYKRIAERDVDCITLDLPEPWKALKSAGKALKTGGFLVVYNPSIPQISDLVESLGEEFELVKVTEIIERDWEFRKRKIRPKTQGIGHSGFLCFARKIL